MPREPISGTRQESQIGDLFDSERVVFIDYTRNADNSRQDIGLDVAQISRNMIGVGANEENSIGASVCNAVGDMYCKLNSTMNATVVGGILVRNGAVWYAYPDLVGPLDQKALRD